MWRWHQPISHKDTHIIPLETLRVFSGYRDVSRTGLIRGDRDNAPTSERQLYLDPTVVSGWEFCSGTHTTRNPTPDNDMAAGKNTSKTPMALTPPDVTIPAVAVVLGSFLSG